MAAKRKSSQDLEGRSIMDPMPDNHHDHQDHRHAKTKNGPIIVNPIRNNRRGYNRLGDRVPARVVLYILSFTGFLVSFMMRNDINLAIVAMVKTPPPPLLLENGTDPDGLHHRPLYCVVQPPPTDNNATTAPNQPPPQETEEGEFDWDTSIQSTITGSFYWCYVLAQVVGGALTQRFGTKKVFGYSQLATALSSLLIPHAAVLHYSLIILLRSIQGAASGLTWPAMYSMVGVWIPMVERSRFMSSFQGFSIGIGVTYPLCGFIIAHFGWRPVFYVTGGLGCLWCLAWFTLAFDHPDQHPRISKRELIYIQQNIDKTVVNGKGMKVPWLSILKSLPAIAIGVTTFGRIWVHYVFIISGPQYMKNVLGFNIQQNGILSGAPFLCSYLSSVVFCYLADLFVTREIFTLTTTRKIFTAASQVVPGLLVVLIGYLGCDVVPVLVVWFTAVTLITASYAGAMANVVDISPNFAGPVLAFAQTIHMTASFVSPMVAGLIVTDTRSLDEWRIVFGVSAVVAFITYVFYQLLGTSEVQSWNNTVCEVSRGDSPREDGDSDAKSRRSETSNGGSQVVAVAASAEIGEEADDRQDDGDASLTPLNRHPDTSLNI